MKKIPLKKKVYDWVSKSLSVNEAWIKFKSNDKIVDYKKQLTFSKL